MSYRLLNEPKIGQLLNYRLSLNAVGEAIDYPSLADPERLPGVLDRLTRRLAAPNACVTASILTKRLAFYAVLHLYSMTGLGRSLDVDLLELKLVDETREDLWLPVFEFGNFNVEQPEVDRDLWREGIVKHVFADALAPVIGMLKEQTRLKESIMWENTALYIHWIYNQMSADPGLAPHVADDLHYIFHEAPGWALGPYSENPLTPFAGTSEDGRSTCCLSYMLQGRQYCKTCPVAPPESS